MAGMQEEAIKDYVIATELSPKVAENFRATPPASSSRFIPGTLSGIAIILGL